MGNALNMSTEDIIKYGSFSVGFMICVASVVFMLYGVVAAGLIMLIAGAVIAVVPYSIYSYIMFARFKRMEEEFPRFLRDFAESKKSGMTFPQALSACQKTDYGPLSDVVSVASRQLSWNVPFNTVIKHMMKAADRSNVIKRAFTIIMQSADAGGNVSEVMDAIAMDINTIREITKERQSALMQQVAIMYFIFFLFLGIVMMLFRLLVPMIGMNISMSAGIGSLGTGGAAEAANSCTLIPTMCSFCPVFWPSKVGQLCYYQSLFFFMAIVEAVSIGVIAGKIGSGSIVAGVKHGLIMVVCAVLAFVLMG